MEREEFDHLSPEEQKAHLARIERFIMAPGHWPEVNSLQLGILLRAGGDAPVAVEEVMLSMQNWFGINPEELSHTIQPMIEKEWVEYNDHGFVQTTPLGREVLAMHKAPLTKAVMWSLKSGISNMEEQDEEGDP